MDNHHRTTLWSSVMTTLETFSNELIAQLRDYQGMMPLGRGGFASVYAARRRSDGMDVAILESMKMQLPVSSSEVGKVEEVKVASGDFVNEGDLIITLS